jgi:hypothetical protein
MWIASRKARVKKWAGGKRAAASWHRANWRGKAAEGDGAGAQPWRAGVSVVLRSGIISHLSLASKASIENGEGSGSARDKNHGGRRWQSRYRNKSRVSVRVKQPQRSQTGISVVA